MRVDHDFSGAARSVGPAAMSATAPVARPPAALGHPGTAELMDRHLEARRNEQRFDPREIRLSEAGHCSRRQTLRILGYDEDPTTLDQEAIFDFGHEQEEHMADLWRALYPGEGEVQREVEVHSPFGTGHMDVWIAPIRHYVECKTTKKKSIPYLPLEEHVDQVTLYEHFSILPTGGGTAEIAYKIKETGRVLSFPVVYDRKRAERLVARLQAVKDAVAFGSPLPMERGMSLDQFPCGWEGDDGRLVTCPFWRHCWTAEAQETTREPATAKLLARLKAAEDGYRAAKKAEEEEERERNLLRQAVLKIMAVDGVTNDTGWTVLVAGGVEAAIKPKAGRTTYDGRAAIAAGVVTEKAFAPFVHRGEPQTMWAVRDLVALKAKLKGA